jgi:hypothetical protein
MLRNNAKCNLLPIFLLFPIVALPITLRVPDDYVTIQEAIDASTDGDTVLVAPGTYTGPNNFNLDFLGKRIVVTSENGSEETTINCQSSSRGAYFHSGEDSNSVLDGFTILEGSVSGELIGGGIFCYNASPTIKNNVITGCYAYWGGGIGCLYASPQILNNSIVDNEGERGGGIAILEVSNPILRGNIIQNNRADGG